MWMFAAYEMLRTWHQRVSEFQKLVSSGGVDQKIKAIEGDAYDYQHLGRESLLAQLRALSEQPELMEVAKRHQRSIHYAYFRLDFIRIALAKHEVKGRSGAKALNPGYGRINKYCGAIDYEMENGKYIFGRISRRDVADSLRELDLDSEPPDQAELKRFEQFMVGKLGEPF